MITGGDLQKRRGVITGGDVIVGGDVITGGDLQKRRGVITGGDVIVGGDLQKRRACSTGVTSSPVAT